MKKSIKSIVALVCICAVVAILMAITNIFTAPIISENENKKANAALLEVMPNGGSFEKVDISKHELPATVTEAYKTENGGYVIKLTTTGYSTGFVIMCGVNADGTVSGAVCLASTETLGKEQTYGQNFVGKDSTGVDAVEIISGATKTTAAYRSAIKDAINTAIILGGGSVDIRTEEEILNDNLSAALPSAEGKFSKHFFVEIVEEIDAIYLADNKSGAVCVIGEQFIATDASGNVTTSCDEATAKKVSDAIAKINATTTTDVKLSDYEGLPSQLVWAKKTASGNYVLQIKGAGFGIAGDNEYVMSGEYIIIHVSMTKDGKIIDCLTVDHSESKGYGDACADEKFYSQFDGKTESDYKNIDAISGATYTTNGYTKAIERAFNSVKIFEGGAQ